ncbi:MAG: TatD family hydrolase [Bacteroidales bacterium]|nr:TatD family hydrolase [Bacteroidales bacterium]
MKLIDTHAHLYLPEFDSDRTEIVNNALQSGIAKIFLPNIDSSTVKPMLTLTEEFPGIFFPLIGLHPTSVNENFQDELSKVREWLTKYRFWGIGEVGIDLYWDKTFRDQQMEAFREQVNIGLESELPVIIHSRESFDEIFFVLEEFKGKPLSGIFHSFTGTALQAKRAIEMGFLIGINGIVTFKNSGLDQVVKEIGLEKLVLETDSPYLSPVPRRGKRNESAYLLYIAEKLADIFSCDLETIIENTSKNALEVFKID